jgi:hypothetical protein
MGTYVHADKTRGDDEAFCILEFDGGALGIVEDSWGRRGGMDDRIEVYGSDGVTYANLHMGNALPTYSENGYGYAVEKAPSTKGWSYPVFEELWNYGFPQEMTHFARCVRGGAPGNGRRWVGRHEGLVCGLRIRRGRTKNTNAFLREGRAQTHRSVVSRSAVSAASSTQVKPSMRPRAPVTVETAEDQLTSEVGLLIGSRELIGPLGVVVQKRR